MSKVRAHISASLDAYVAGPNQSHENPLGVGGGGGERLFAGVGPDLKLEALRAVEAPGVAHLKYRVVK